MLHSGKLAAALAAKQPDLRQATRHQADDLSRLRQVLADWAEVSQTELEKALAASPWPGALPTPEQDTQPLLVPFTPQWPNHHQARAWAREVLKGVTTFAADGSHLAPEGELALPVGLIQVGWFENRHQPQGDYTKDVSLELLAAPDLTTPAAIDWRRFRGELAQLEAIMSRQTGQPAVAFFDGSLIGSFLQNIPLAQRRPYLAQIEQLLVVSEETQVPVVAYIDQSHARDLSDMLAHLGQLQPHGWVSDPLLLRALMPGWGSRARFFRCARQDRYLAATQRRYYRRVLFTYLQTGSRRPPVRLELPDWVLDRGRHEWVLNIIRAECVVGLGYPYPLEAADAVAVLTRQDRARFLATLQVLADELELPATRSAKAVSKRRRR